MIAALPLGHSLEPLATLEGSPSTLITTPSSDTKTRILQVNRHILHDVLIHLPGFIEF